MFHKLASLIFIYKNKNSRALRFERKARLCLIFGCFIWFVYNFQIEFTPDICYNIEKYVFLSAAQNRLSCTDKKVGRCKRRFA
jgi:hypothetical protein